MATRDPLLGLRQEAARREQATAQRQIADMAGISDATPSPPPPAPFSTSNEDALAAHLRETQEKSAEYLRLNSEDARQQYIDAAADTFRRNQAHQQEGAVRGGLEREQRTAQDNQAGERLAIQMQSLTDTFPPNWTPETLSMDQLRTLTDLRQQVNNLAAATGAQGLADGVLESGGPLAPANVLGNQMKQARPEAFPDGSLYQLKNLPDGNLEVQLITGERFSGDPITVTQRMAEAQVNTKLWARQKVAQAQTPQLVNQPAEQVQAVQPASHNSIADYWAAEQAQALAKQFGFSGKDEMLQWGENVNQKMASIAQYEDDRLAINFAARCPDFPATPEASDALVSIVQANGWQYNLDSLQAAHLLATRNHVYEPLSAEAQQASSGHIPQVHRPSAPPMLQGNNPEITHAVPSPYDMPMHDLRKAAIRQELERNTPNYR